MTNDFQMSEELRARFDALIAGLRANRDAGHSGDTLEPDEVETLLSFASSAAGQREGWREALEAARPIVLGDAEQGAEYADADWEGRARHALALIDAALASPSAPEERRDEVEPLRGSPPEPVSNPSASWCEEYADWYYMGKS